ncbi:MAG: YbaB/EbfC family nucleoid-associated protein [Saprospiraceae bacterium]|nr:YbaB/EbfC family nucleoid-associated protein [Saprospiraceae bacterium]
MFGDLQKKQEEIKQKLAEIQVSAEAGDGIIKVTVNGNRELVDVNIANDFDYDKEELEDLILVAVNKAMAEAAAKEQEESQRLINEMLPPGMGGMFGM